MDNAIQTANEKLLYVTGDEDAQREYLVRFRAMCDMTSMQNAAHREGVKEGLAQGREEILKLFEQGLSVDEIKVQLNRQITDNK
jgi:DNA-binding NarL/FixJ family response regulator